MQGGTAYASDRGDCDDDETGANRIVIRPMPNKYSQMRKLLAEALLAGGAHLVTGGTENHLIVINTATGFGISGDVAETALGQSGHYFE